MFPKLEACNLKTLVKLQLFLDFKLFVNARLLIRDVKSSNDL